MKKRIINTPDAPEAVGAYNQATISPRGLVLTAGQIALRPKGEGDGLANGSIEEETRQVMTNLQAVLGAAGCQLADVLHTVIFITDKDIFPRVDAAYAEHFLANGVDDEEVPGRACVVAMPPLDGAHVEMFMTAEVPVEFQREGQV